MNPEPHPRLGFRLWFASAAVLLMAGNIAVEGWDCWNRRPGGDFSAQLYAVVLIVSLPSLPKMFAAANWISDARLRRSLLFLNVLLALGYVGLNVLVGPTAFTSMRGGGLYYHATFLSCIIVTISPDLIKMAFPFR